MSPKIKNVKKTTAVPWTEGSLIFSKSLCICLTGWKPNSSFTQWSKHTAHTLNFSLKMACITDINKKSVTNHYHYTDCTCHQNIIIYSHTKNGL